METPNFENKVIVRWPLRPERNHRKYTKALIVLHGVARNNVSAYKAVFTPDLLGYDEIKIVQRQDLSFEDQVALMADYDVRYVGPCSIISKVIDQWAELGSSGLY